MAKWPFAKRSVMQNHCPVVSLLLALGLLGPSSVFVSGCTARPKKNSAASESPTASPNPQPSGSLNIISFQGQPPNQWSLHPTTGSIRTNSNQFTITGSCLPASTPFVKMAIDGSDVGSAVECLSNSFSFSVATNLSDNWNAPGNSGLGYKVDLIPLDSNQAVISQIPTVAFYVLLKAQAPGALQFTNLSFYQGNSPQTQVIHSGDTLTISPDLNSGGVGNTCSTNQAEVRLNGTYDPSSSDQNIAITPSAVAAHNGNNFLFQICLNANETKNIQITLADSYGNPSASPLNLNVHFQSNSDLNTVVPYDLASSFTFQSLAPDFANSQSGSLTLVHAFSSATSSEPMILSTNSTGFSLDFDFNHYITQVLLRGDQ